MESRASQIKNLYPPVLVIYKVADVRASAMIHEQVHLLVPCYDFYPVQAIAIKVVSICTQPLSHIQSVPTLLETAQSRIATGGVYKGQGRNQRELMTHTYQEFLVQGK